MRLFLWSNRRGAVGQFDESLIDWNFVSKLIVFVTFFAFVSSFVWAQEVEVWTSEFSQGTKRDQKPDQIFDEHQDEGLRLLAKSRLTQEEMARTPKELAEALVVDLESSERFQEVYGVGGAMTESSAWLLQSLRKSFPDRYEYLMDRFFSSEDGVGLSVLRVPLGASDYTSKGYYYTYCDSESDDLSKFSIDIDRDSVMPMLKEAKQRNPNLILIGTPWSAPGWMKRSGKLIGVTEQEKEAGVLNRLRLEAIELYAQYLVLVLEAYRAEGLEFSLITLQNEPQADLTAYPCMRLTLEDYQRLIRALGPKIDAAGLKARILVHDHNWKIHDGDQKVLGGDSKEVPLELVDALMSDPQLSKWIAGSSWHCYAGNDRDMAEVYSKLRNRHPNKVIGTLEASAWGLHRNPDWYGDIAWGLRHNWFGGFLQGSSVSLQWNLALDDRGGPSPRSDSEGVGLVTIESDGAFRFEREFYAMGHVSLAAQSGAVRLSAKKLQLGVFPEDAIQVLGFEEKMGRQSIVVWNDSGLEGWLCVQGERVERSLGRSFFVKLPPKGMVTCRWAKDGNRDN